MGLRKFWAFLQMVVVLGDGAASANRKSLFFDTYIKFSDKCLASTALLLS